VCNVAAVCSFVRLLHPGKMIVHVLVSVNVSLPQKKMFRIEDICFNYFEDENKSAFLTTIQSVAHREHTRLTLL